jgi:hypothetical protein
MIFATVDKYPASDKYTDNFEFTIKIAESNITDICYCWKIVKSLPTELSTNNHADIFITFINLFLNMCTHQEIESIIKYKKNLRIKLTDNFVAMTIKKNIINSELSRLRDNGPINMITIDIITDEHWYYIMVNKPMFVLGKIDKYHIVYNKYENIATIIPGVKILYRCDINTPDNNTDQNR